MSSAAEVYVRTQVRSSSPLELVVLLYDSALRFITAARDATARQDLPARRTALSKTMAVINELQASLDVERGGEIAVELDRLYTWANSQIVEAIVRKEIGPLDDVYRVLSTLRDGWQAIAASGAETRP